MQNILTRRGQKTVQLQKKNTIAIEENKLPVMSHCRQQEKRSQRQIYTLICVADILDLTTESQES
jgi:hypothetical protein